MRLPRYPKYKDSGVKWLGQVPEHWEVKALKYVATLNDDDLPENTDPDYEINYVDIGSVSLERGIEKTEVMPFGEAPSRARRRVKGGDVIISTVRTYLKAICPIDHPEENLIASTGFAVVRPRRDTSPRFAHYALQAQVFIDDVIARSTGVSYPAINPSELQRIKIPLPEPCEQELISAFLEKEIGKFDALVEQQKLLIELLKEKRQAMISHAVTRGLNPDAPMKPSGIDWIGEIPVHWSVIRLKFMAYVQGGVAKGRNLEDQKTIEVPYLRVANVQDGYLDLDDIASIEIPPAELKRYRLEQGDVLMNEGGDFDKLGRGHIWRGEIQGCIHQNHVFAVRPRKIESEWLNINTSAECGRFYFMSRSKQSTNLASISSTNIQELPVPCPPKEERLRIIEHVNEKIHNLDQLVANAESNIDLLVERRSALISAAVTGQVDVRNYRPEEVHDLCQ